VRVQLTRLGGTVDRWVSYIAKAVAGNISYGATMANGTDDINMNVWKAQGTSPGTANVEFSIAHSLNRVPITIVGQDTENGGLIYRGSTAWTETTVYLKSTAASSVYRVILA